MVLKQEEKYENKKYILWITSIICVISLICAVVTESGNKINNIFFGVIGSSLVSFFIEITEYYIEYGKAKKIFINTSFNIWITLNRYLFLINAVKKEENKAISENTFSPQVDQLNGLFMGYNYIDEYLYSKKSEYKSFLEKINKIQFEINSNKTVFMYLFTAKKIELLERRENRSLNAFDMQKEILELEEKTKSKFELYETEFVKILNKKELNAFQKSKATIDNVNKEFKDNGIRFV